MSTGAVISWPSTKYLWRLFIPYCHMSHLRQTVRAVVIWFRATQTPFCHGTGQTLQYRLHKQKMCLTLPVKCNCLRPRGNQGKYGQLQRSRLPTHQMPAGDLLYLKKQRSRMCPVLEPKCFPPWDTAMCHVLFQQFCCGFTWAKIVCYILPKCDRSLWSVHYLRWWC